MPDISVQFYGLESELIPFIENAVTEYGLHAVAIRLRPFGAICIGVDQVATYCPPPSDRRWLAFTLRAPTLPAAHELDFAAKNPDHLRLDIGRQLNEGLEESWLMTRTVNPEAFAVWRKMAARLKKMTAAGVTAINRITGETAYYRSTRYTPGAARLEALGIAMLPPQGPQGPFVRLGDKRTGT